MGTLVALLHLLLGRSVALLRRLPGVLRERRIGDDPDRRLAWLLLHHDGPRRRCSARSARASSTRSSGSTACSSSLRCWRSGRRSCGWRSGVGSRRRELEDLRVPDAVVIGAAQALALFPGISRSGITISAASSGPDARGGRPLLVPDGDAHHRRRRHLEGARAARRRSRRLRPACRSPSALRRRSSRGSSRSRSCSPTCAAGARHSSSATDTRWPRASSSPCSWGADGQAPNPAFRALTPEGARPTIARRSDRPRGTASGRDPGHSRVRPASGRHRSRWQSLERFLLSKPASRRASPHDGAQPAYAGDRHRLEGERRS